MEAEHFDLSGNDGVIGEFHGSGVVSLDGQRRLWPSHLYECVLESDHLLGDNEVANAMTNLTIWETVRTCPLRHGMGSFSARKMLVLAQLHDFDLLRKLASECAASIMLLARYVLPSDGYVAKKSSNWSI